MTRKILVFGTFDGIHLGHINFLRQAKAQGDFLVIAVGRDEIIKKLKNKLPKHSMEKRMKMLENSQLADKIISGDEVLGIYTVINQENPDMICLGYDQKNLGQDLSKWLSGNNLQISIKYLEPYIPEKYHTSIIDKE